MAAGLVLLAHRRRAPILPAQMKWSPVPILDQASLAPGPVHFSCALLHGCVGSRITYLMVPPSPSKPEQFLVLPGHKVDSGVLQQSREDKQQAHSHPYINGLHVGHLGEKRG